SVSPLPTRTNGCPLPRLETSPGSDRHLATATRGSLLSGASTGPRAARAGPPDQPAAARAASASHRHLHSLMDLLSTQRLPRPVRPGFSPEGAGYSSRRPGPPPGKIGDPAPCRLSGAPARGYHTGVAGSPPGRPRNKSTHPYTFTSRRSVLDVRTPTLPP